ncbi:MAG: hypothetical protein E6J42_00100 [Chloroflexi bacterium]|nr:MAG: hypothetical protein E6J42_00100 [Chloroflexota bacterium]
MTWLGLWEIGAAEEVVMDYRFSVDEDAFRGEVKEFLRGAIPEDWDYDPFELTGETWDFAKEFTKKLASKGWVAPAWPKEYGGQGMGYMKQVVLSEELAYSRAPNTALIGVTYAGPTIIVYGNEEQKQQFIPGITSGDIVWCQGYSERNAGSDIAWLQRRAVRDGDDYVILTGASSWLGQTRTRRNTRGSATSSRQWTLRASA